jgi:hypothetical protein
LFNSWVAKDIEVKKFGIAAKAPVLLPMLCYVLARTEEIFRPTAFSRDGLAAGPPIPERTTR